MTYKEGQALWGQVSFSNGQAPAYNRPYLIVTVLTDKIGIVDISTVQGKEKKLLYKTNYHISQYNPPLFKDSFAKLDSYRLIPLYTANRLKVMDGGKTLNQSDLTAIKNKILKPRA